MVFHCQSWEERTCLLTRGQQVDPETEWMPGRSKTVMTLIAVSYPLHIRVQENSHSCNAAGIVWSRVVFRCVRAFWLAIRMASGGAVSWLVVDSVVLYFFSQPGRRTTYPGFPISPCWNPDVCSYVSRCAGVGTNYCFLDLVLIAPPMFRR